MDPRRILVLTEGQLGDLLLLTPALRMLARSFPSATITLLIVQRRAYGAVTTTPQEFFVENPQWGTSEIATRASSVHETLELRRHLLRALHGRARLKAELSIVRRLREGAFDTVICCFPDDRFAMLAYLSGATVRIGQRRQALRWLLTHAPDVKKEESGVLDYYCRLAREAGASVEPGPTEFPVDDDDRRGATRRLKEIGIVAGQRFALVHPGASGPYRVWPPERFAEVISRLKGEERLDAVLCGTEYDERILTAVRKRLPQPVCEIRLEGSVAELAALLEASTVCLSNDSGPRHLAVAVGTPSVAIMPKHNDRAWGIYGEERKSMVLMGEALCPLCPEDECLDRIPEGETFGSCCMRMVTVDAVMDRLRRVLSSSPQSASLHRP